MALSPAISNAAAIAAVDAIVDLIDVGGGTAYLRIYDGTQATDPDTAVGAQTLLAQLEFSATAFGNAADATGKATATANSITTDGNCPAAGTATWFRVISKGGLAIFDGSVGTSGCDLNLDNVVIVLGGSCAVSDLTLSLPEQ